MEIQASEVGGAEAEYCSASLEKLRKHLTPAQSGAEAEYYSASLGAVEVVYRRQLLRDMGFGPTSPTPAYEDNTACIEWTNNAIGGGERARHIDIRKHFAHEAAA